MRCPVAVVGLLVLCSAAVAEGPFDGFTQQWRGAEVWAGGGVECAVYEARRTIDGEDFAWVARLYTSREWASPQTFTTSVEGEGRAVFRQAWQEAVPVEAGGVQRAAMCYVGVDDLKSLKLEASTQEPAGVTFKWFVNHGGELRWEQFAYQAGAGRNEGTLVPQDNLVFHNALPTVLRGYPFDQPAEMELAVIEDQMEGRWTNTKPGKFVLRYGGRQVLKLPIGEVEAHQLLLFFTGPAREFRPLVKLWFATDPAMRHVMVQQEGPGKVRYRLWRLDPSR